MNRRGLTLIEVIVALAILSVALSAFTLLILGSVRQNVESGGRTQAAQLLNYLGRRLVGADDAVMPDSTSTYREWNYGTLRTSFPELTREGRFANPDLYRARIDNEGTPAWAVSGGLNLDSLRAYRIQVCWRGARGESCVEARTVGAAPVAGGAAAPLPGIN
ncbi:MULTISPECIES: prepilin-type N-terminal cleavage/methylation domain-containing protein [unclassified Meiothermus]|uniref:prepilin-type N-terminal cleavage/methylation domain-containing protein n=1 Tax=unclassified Meiothermus TaxID=370471 RepID=UPI000D7C429F|nr:MULTISPECIES: prepilin-type N-terminal cleavage/methylation domain-containing protein [unclassified Meiothermus]PZA08584.1 prepilin-type cleavage/methylation domain-containing protein [Meiothermus sp. Pnk-1]RYM40799.1 prepilin-type N-terminal cleavage/methylation domain-containing protein [Meiothermus sp. PNK-Is4]